MALPGGPFVVSSAPSFQVRRCRHSPGLVTFSRKVDRSPSFNLTPAQATPLQCQDLTAPTHRKPIKYKADAPNFRDGTVDVISLDTFSCGGLVVVRDAESIGVPIFAARAGTWTEELSLSRGGATELQVFHGFRAAQISLSRAGETPSIQATQAGSHFVSFTEDLEDNDTLELSVTDNTGAEIGRWTVQVTIQDIADVSNSRLELLIAQHRMPRRKSVPHAPDIPLHRLELGSYLPSRESWKPVLACWASRVPSRLAIDWSDKAALGDIFPQIDPRPLLSPPQQLLDAREAVRSLIQQQQRSISEVEIDNPIFGPLIEDYLRRYLEWLRAEPHAACWFDVFVIHAAEWNAQAGRHVASDEPVVMLLSPLHPIRLGWHAVAQKQLAESLQSPCSAAGLLTPSQCPDAGVLYLSDGQAQKARAFFSLPGQHPHWAISANTEFLDKPGPRSNTMQCLSDLGLMVEGITGGFTSQQTQDSLHEVGQLLPARMTLRVGIVGDQEISSECGDGVFRWSERHYEGGRTSPIGCLEVEVFDTRGSADPSPEQLADLSERTAEHVRWFKLPPNAGMPRLDLTIIDQLGARSPEAVNGTTDSVMAPGSLFRVRIREDFQNARAIVELRVTDGRVTGAQLPSSVAEAVQTYENLSKNDRNKTHFRFTPNQDAVGIGYKIQSSFLILLQPDRSGLRRERCSGARRIPLGL